MVYIFIKVKRCWWNRAFYPYFSQKQAANQLAACFCGGYARHSLSLATLPQYVREPYKRFLENEIRENWKFTGVPVNIFIRQK